MPTRNILGQNTKKEIRAKDDLKHLAVKTRGSIRGLIKSNFCEAKYLISLSMEILISPYY